MLVNLNSQIFAREGARVAPCMGISGYQSPSSYVSDEETWAEVAASMNQHGWDWHTEAYENSSNEGPIGGRYFIHHMGYVYGYVMNHYGDLDSFGFTTEGIHNRCIAKGEVAE